MPDPTTSEILSFGLFSVLALFASTPAIIIFSRIYEQLGIYHYLERNSEEYGLRRDECESLLVKIVLVATYNFVAVTVTIALVSFYQSGNISLSITGIFAIAILTIVLQSALRVAAFIDIGYLSHDDDIEHEAHIKRIRDRILGFGFSFMASIYFLLIISIGISLGIGASGQQLFAIGRNPNVVIGLSYVVGTIAAIILTAWLGEHVLARIGVHDCLKTTKSS